MQWGWTTDEKNAWAVMDRFVEAGGNFIDTADVYSRWVEKNPGGVAEEIIGRWLKDRSIRRDVVLATKVGGPMWEGRHGQGLSRKHIIEAVEDSLRRLQVDYIDLYQAHIPDMTVPIEETIRAFDILVGQGKVLYIGASNYRAWQLSQALAASRQGGWVRYDSVQSHYNLVHRADFERDLKPLCEQEGIGVLPYSPLGGGFLTGKYKREEPLPHTARSGQVREQYFDDERAWRILDMVREVAQACEKTILQVSLAWLLSQPVVTAPVIGANTVMQLEESLGAVGFQVSSEDMQRLDEVSGGPFDWHR